jgi:hypothetical protein
VRKWNVGLVAEVLGGELMDGTEIVERLEGQRLANPKCTQLTISESEVAALAEHLCWFTDLSAETTAQHMREGTVTIGGKRLVVLPSDVL